MAGYSKTPLLKKLGLKPGMRVAFVGMPESVQKDIGPLPEGVSLLKKPAAEMDYIHFFAESDADLKRAFAGLKQAIKKGGMLWISWRKGKKSDLTESAIRALALAAGLVDVKVCAVDDEWSGLKLVYRLKDR